MNDIQTNRKETSNILFPVFLKLHNLKTLIVGGGNVGLEKTESILKNSPGARITLVAPEIKPKLFELAVFYPNVTLAIRNFEDKDLYEKDLVIVATRNKVLNNKVYALAKKHKILVNVADTPEYCDFYLGSVVTKGDLKIAISTNGKSPTFAKRFREMLETSLPDNLQPVLDNLWTIRDRLKGDFNHKVQVLNKITANLVSSHEG